MRRLRFTNCFVPTCGYSMDLETCLDRALPSRGPLWGRRDRPPVGSSSATLVRVISTNGHHALPFSGLIMGFATYSDGEAECRDNDSKHCHGSGYPRPRKPVNALCGQLTVSSVVNGSPAPEPLGIPGLYPLILAWLCCAIFTVVPLRRWCCHTTTEPSSPTQCRSASVCPSLTSIQTSDCWHARLSKY